MDEAHVERRLAAILVADIAGYSRLMAEDEAATVAEAAGAKRLLLTHRPNERLLPDSFELAGDGLEVDF